MSGTSWGSSSDGDDDSWWGYVASAAASYADSEGEKKGKKQDLKDKIALMERGFALKDEYEQKAGARLADAYKGYEQYNRPTAADSAVQVDPMAAFKRPQQQGLMSYGRG